MKLFKSFFIAAIKIKLILSLFVLAVNLFASTLQIEAATTTTYTTGYYTTPPAYTTSCINSSGCTSQIPNCWNSERMGVTDCGLACGGGNAWAKYNRTGCFQTSYDSYLQKETCEATYVETSAVCSTADKYDSENKPVMKWGSCNCGVGGQYKTCCSGINLVDATSTTIDNNSPPEAYCPSGSSIVYCGQAGQPDCGQAACGYPAPTPLPTTAPTPIPTAAMNSGCSGYTCTYSDTDGRCYGGTGAWGFNSAGCTYKCGPVTCPSGGNTAPTPTPAPVLLDCTIGGFSVSNSKPLPNTPITVSTWQVADPNNGLNVGFKVDGGVSEGVTTANSLNDGYAFTKNDLNSRYPGPHNIYLTTGNESKVCTPPIPFTTVSDVPAPTVAVQTPGCINGPLSDPSGTGTASIVKISWTTPGSHPITYVDISTTEQNFGTFYNKAVTGTGTNAPYGFGTNNGYWNGSSWSSKSLTLQPNIPYSFRLFNDYAQGPATSFTIPSCVELSGHVWDTSGNALGGVTINSGNTCGTTAATSIVSGLYVMPSIPAGNAVCFTPPATAAYNSNTYKTPNPGTYSWQFAGRTNAQTCTLYPGSNWCINDLSVDNAYNFKYTPDVPPTPTNIPTPSPPWVKTSGGDVHENQ